MGMNSTNTMGGLGEWLRHGLPVALLVFLALLQQIPTYIPDFTYMTPALVMGGVFYWSIYRPDLMPTIMVFLLGMFEDIMTSQLMGTNAFVLLIVYGLCQWQRRFFFKRSFAIMWWGLIIVAVGMSVLKWVLSMIIYGQVLSYLPLFFVALSTIAVYPLLSLVCSVVHQYLPDDQ